MAWDITNDTGGAALWLPPGVSPDGDALVDVLQRSLSRERLPEVMSLLEQMGSFHPSGTRVPPKLTFKGVRLIRTSWY
jgi:hypothetical protein